MFEFKVESFNFKKYSNKQLISLPLTLLLISILILGGWYLSTGLPVNPGIEFTGGTEITLISEGGIDPIYSTFEWPIDSIRPIATQANAYIVTFQSSTVQPDQLELVSINAGFDVLAVQSTSPSFGAESQKLALFGLAMAFTGMAIVVFLLFRKLIPSVAVVLSALGDIVIPLAIMNLLGIQLSLGTVAALLMLIGYSVDSDILLTNHILKRKGNFYESTYNAMRTGLTMTFTSLSAIVVMTIASFLFGVDLLTSIGVVLIFGLIVDLLNTYLLNFSLLRWYIEGQQ
jgi:preprotein translocase subunit SecF